MSDWFHDLAVPWMALLIFGVTYLIAAAVYAVVSVLAVAERARVQGCLTRYVASARHHLQPFRRIYRRPGLER
jgi:hypothetical protein